MLTEHLVASTLDRGQKATTSTAKDAGIHLCELKPQFATRSTFKKSSTQPSCLAVNLSHVYAAQADKAVVHVYNREKNNQEAVVPFPERIHSVVLNSLLDGTGILVLGTESGRLILWEVSTGRSISTSTSHLQPVTCLASDPGSTFILSGSADSNIHVWSLPNTLSFDPPSSSDFGRSATHTPFHTLSDHRAPVTSIAVGGSRFKSNIALSTSRDSTALVWEYQSGKLLRTILLPATPLCVTLDPADRAAFVGYEDGTVQTVDFFPAPSLENPLHDPTLQSNPLQAKASERWTAPVADVGATNCIALTYDGTTLLSGHDSGKILSWDTAKRKYMSEVQDLTSSVTNLIALPLEGVLNHTKSSTTVLSTIVKARYDHMLSGSPDQSVYSVPASYTSSTHFASQIVSPNLAASASPSNLNTKPPFFALLSHNSFPDFLIAEGVSELSSWSTQKQSSGTQEQAPQPNDHGEDMIMLEPSPQDSESAKLAKENAILRERIEDYETERKRTWDHLVELNTLNFGYRKMESLKHKKKRKRKQAQLAQEEKDRSEWLKQKGIEFEGEGEELVVEVVADEVDEGETSDSSGSANEITDTE